MSAVAIAPSPLRLPPRGRGWALLILPCRASCGAPKVLVAPHPHRTSGRALNAARAKALPHFPRPLWDSLASSASSGLSPLGRCRRFGSLAPALPAYVGLGSPARTANADGSSLPTTARPSSHVTHPATDDGRGHAGSARRRDSLRRPPPPQGARMFRAQGT